MDNFTLINQNELYVVSTLLEKIPDHFDADTEPQVFLNEDGGFLIKMLKSGDPVNIEVKEVDGVVRVTGIVN